MTTPEEKRATIMALQYKHSIFSGTLATALSNGSCAECLLDKNAAILMGIDTIKRYHVVGAPITYSYQITFSVIKTSIATISVDIDSVTIGTYVGGASAEDVAEGVALSINGQTETTGYYAVTEGGKLIIYSTSESASYNNVPDVSISLPSIVASLLSLEGDNSVVFNALNCITEEQMCNIKKYLFCFLNKIT